MGMFEEIFEQPVVIERLLAKQREIIQEAANAILQKKRHFGYVAARGTSDNAGRYAVYTWGAFNQLAVGLATPSLFSFYQTPPGLDKGFVVGISQSGQSPDIVSVLAEGRHQGVLTLAITNSPASPLAESADWVIDISAGEERAVAATKTYTAELMAVAMLSAALDVDHPERWDELARVPDWMRTVLQLDSILAGQAQRFTYMQACVVLGRGFNYASAFEWSLKLKELAYVVAEPYSSADFLHGPIAMVSHGFPVLAVAPSGKVFPHMQELLVRLLQEQAADLVVISDDEEILDLAETPIPLPNDIPEWLTPLVAIVPAQLFTYHLTRTRGFDTEHPRSIRKVTETR